MPLLDVPVPNLLGGVSQQPAANRQPGQVEACDNALLHVVNGLAKRHGTRHLAKLITGLESVVGVHFINRDAERYAVLMGERRLRVFDANDGTEYPVKVNGTSTDAGRGRAGTGTPLAYLDPRVPGGVLNQDEDFVIGGAGNWQTAAGNSVTSYVSGRGPFNFGRRESIVTVNADTVAEVGNGAAALVSDINLVVGLTTTRQAFSVFVKKSSSAINDIELTMSDGAFVNFAGARFDISAGGVVTLGALINTGTNPLTAEVVNTSDSWYRITIRVTCSSDFPPPGDMATNGVRTVRIRFHTNAATPANKRALLFGARLYDDLLPTSPVPNYVFPNPDLFRALTVSDSTFLLNTEQVVGATGGTSPSGGSTVGIVWVQQGGFFPNVSYTLTLKGTTSHVYTVTPVGAPTAATDAIVTAFATAINAAGFFAATPTVGGGSILRITNGTENLVNVVASDSRGDTLMKAFISPGGSVTHFTDLPLDVGASSALVLINGNPERAVDDYYASFALDANSAARGTWSEGAAPSIPNTLSAGTMPQLLTRRQDDAVGTKTGRANSIYFDVSPVTWANRLVGSQVSNPDPKFVGQKIRDVFIYRGRLGFLSLNTVSLSEAGEVFNFWRTTVLDLVDTDPISVDAGVCDVSLLRNAASTGDRLLVFSDRHQFELLGDPTLTPSTAQLAPTRSFESLPQARPVDAGRGIVFARYDGTFSNLLHAALIQQDVTVRIEELTVQAPRYIVGAIQQMAASNLTGLHVSQGSDRSMLFVHQSFFDDQENRLQSAPHRWTFNVDTQVKGFGFYDADLRLVVERSQGWFLETIKTNAETTEGGRPIALLDRRVTQAQCTLAYDGGTNRTTITLPYNIASGATMQVVDATSGLIVPLVSTGTNTVVVTGNLSASSLFVGESYTMSVTLTEPVIQDQSPRGGLVPRMGRPMDVYRLNLYVANTSFLKTVVAEDLRTPTSEEFSAAGLGTGLLLEGTLNQYTGDATFAVLGQSTQITVSVTNSTPFPSYVQSARWEVLYRQRAGLV